ncbi:immunity 49 family protein [Streptomyces sp. NPDC004042]|uniref:immunity 49 family protein n=1 Tax=Streptomyces sp. NPDC004042 TaxID=3154451 RepID=UPI0033AD87DF
MERHQVGDARVAAAVEGFAGRVGRLVHSFSKAGPVTAYEYRLITEEFLDCLGALSVADPGLGSPEAKAVLEDAAEAAVGAVAYAAYHPVYPFDVFLPYVNWGVCHDREEGEPLPVPLRTDWWLDAFCLAVPAGRAEDHAETFRFAWWARRTPAERRTGLPDDELVNGFLAYVLGDTGGEEDGHPPSDEQQVAALDAAIGRVRAGDGGGGAAGPDDRAETVGLLALRALAAGDREAFRDALVRLLRPVAEAAGPDAAPRTLLPLLPLALAALAHRREGRPPEIESDYLPYGPVTGFEREGPRVGPYGQVARSGTRAEPPTEPPTGPAAGPVRFARPELPGGTRPDRETWLREQVRDALDPDPADPYATWELSRALHHLELLVTGQARGAADPGEAMADDVLLGSRCGAVVFRAALAEPGTEVEAELGGRTVRYAAWKADDGPDARTWQLAVNLALISGRPDDLAPLLAAGPPEERYGDTPLTGYRRALHAQLSGTDPRPALDAALRRCAAIRSSAFLPPPLVLLSQFTGGDEESFNLALLDALETHRDHFSVGDRAEGPDAALSLDVLALACHARRRGWEIRVESPYLPPRLLRPARPLQSP